MQVLLYTVQQYKRQADGGRSLKWQDCVQGGDVRIVHDILQSHDQYSNGKLNTLSWHVISIQFNSLLECTMPIGTMTHHGPM